MKCRVCNTDLDILTTVCPLCDFDNGYESFLTFNDYKAWEEHVLCVHKARFLKKCHFLTNKYGGLLRFFNQDCIAVVYDGYHLINLPQQELAKLPLDQIESDILSKNIEALKFQRYKTIVEIERPYISGDVVIRIQKNGKIREKKIDPCIMDKISHVSFNLYENLGIQHWENNDFSLNASSWEYNEYTLQFLKDNYAKVEFSLCVSFYDFKRIEICGIPNHKMQDFLEKLILADFVVGEKIYKELFSELENKIWEITPNDYSL